MDQTAFYGVVSAINFTLRGGVVEGILNAGGSFFPTTNGALLTVRYRASLTSAEQIISMTATPVQDDPVPLVRVVSSFTARSSAASDAAQAASTV